MLSPMDTPQPDAAAPAPRTRAQRRHDAARDALRALVRDVAEREFATHLLGDVPVDLSLSLRIEPANQWAVTFLPDLEDQLREQFGERFAERGAYQPGRVHCFRCLSSDCLHAVPPGPTSVFRQYAATGEPLWQELPQAFIEARDEQVDRLYAAPPQLAALVRTGRELKAEQLASFGRSSKSYALLGQVVCGYFEAPDPGGRFALTFQFVETRTAAGEVALRVNPIGRLPGGADLVEWYAAGEGGWVRRAQARAERALEAMARRINEAGAQRYRVARATLVAIPAIMHQFAQSLDRGARQARRRTRHAEQRRQERRPVQMAYQDATRAGGRGLLYEERSDAVVIPGPQGRIHLFSRAGRHMTSFIGHPGTVEQRMRSQRWTALPAKMADAFRDALAERRPPDTAEDGDAPPEK